MLHSSPRPHLDLDNMSLIQRIIPGMNVEPDTESLTDVKCPRVTWAEE